MVSAVEAKRTVEYYRDRPKAFVKDVLGANFYDAQDAMIESVRDNPFTATCGCNSSGKDFAAARIMIWWQMTHTPAKTIIIGPTNRQVEDIVWQQARLAHQSSKFPLGGEMLKTAKWEVAPEHFALGFATDSPLSQLGFHSPNLLVIVTEAHAVDDKYWTTIKQLNPTRILMTGNPFSMAGEFYDAFHDKKNLWNTIQISAFDTPNVKEKRVVIPGMITFEDVEARKKDWGEDSPKYKASVKGQFCLLTENCYFDMKMLSQMLATSREGEIFRQRIVGHRYAAALDPAGEYGKDQHSFGIMDCQTGEMVVDYTNSKPRHEFALRMYQIWESFGFPLLALEVNGVGEAMWEVLKSLKADPSHLVHHGKDKEKLGTFATGPMREVILVDLQDGIKQGWNTTSSRHVLEECLMFAQEPKKRPEAAGNAHDDRVMMWAWANWCSKQVPSNNGTDWPRSPSRAEYLAGKR